MPRATSDVTIWDETSDNSAAIDSAGDLQTKVNQVTPGTGSTNLGKAEDAVHASGDTGVMALAVRNDTPSALAGASGDYIPLTTDSSGNLRVVQSPSPAGVIVYKAGMLLNGSSGAQNVNGSGTPVDFDFTPGSGETWYLESLGFLIVDGTTPDPNEYGSLGSALTNGLQILMRVNGTEYEFTNIQINAHLTTLFTQSGSPLTSLGWLNDADSFFGGLNFQQPIRLTNSTGDYVRFRVRDNLTGISHQYATYKAWRTV